MGDYVFVKIDFPRTVLISLNVMSVLPFSPRKFLIYFINKTKSSIQHDIQQMQEVSNCGY